MEGPQQSFDQPTSGSPRGFLVPKPKTKPPVATPVRKDWFQVQKSLLLSQREKLWRTFKTLKHYKWESCGLCWFKRHWSRGRACDREEQGRAGQSGPDLKRRPSDQSAPSVNMEELTSFVLRRRVELKILSQIVSLHPLYPPFNFPKQRPIDPWVLRDTYLDLFVEDKSEKKGYHYHHYLTKMFVHCVVAPQFTSVYQLDLTSRMCRVCMFWAARSTRSKPHTQRVSHTNISSDHRWVLQVASVAVGQCRHVRRPMGEIQLREPMGTWTRFNQHGFTIKKYNIVCSKLKPISIQPVIYCKWVVNGLSRHVTKFRFIWNVDTTVREYDDERFTPRNEIDIILDDIGDHMVFCTKYWSKASLSAQIDHDQVDGQMLLRLPALWCLGGPLEVWVSNRKAVPNEKWNQEKLSVGARTCWRQHDLVFYQYFLMILMPPVKFATMIEYDPKWWYFMVA